MSEEDNTFSYFLNHKETILVVSLNGELSEDDKFHFAKCSEDVLKSGANHFILNLQSMSGMNLEMVKDFVLLQTNARTNNMLIYVCAVPMKLAARLKEQGAIRSDETYSTLMSALQVIAKSLKKGEPAA